MWECLFVSVYTGENALQYRRGKDGWPKEDTALLAQGIQEALNEGWEPFAYSHAPYGMWMKRLTAAVPAP